MNIVTFSKNSCIMVEGRENTGRFYIIQKGKVRISREADELTGLESNVAGSGDILGEMSLLENKPRAATAEVYEDCTVYALNRSNFERMIHENLDLIARITTTMAERIWLIYKQLANTLIDNPLGRVMTRWASSLKKSVSRATSPGAAISASRNWRAWRASPPRRAMRFARSSS